MLYYFKAITDTDSQSWSGYSESFLLHLVTKWSKIPGADITINTKKTK